jgi:subtilisin family serine protease
VKLFGLRVLDSTGEGSDAMVLCGIDWVASTRTNANKNDDIAVANMSLGGPGSDDGHCGLSDHHALHLAICNTTGLGVTFVVAAMNDATDLATFEPASYDEVLTATAMADYDGQPAGLASPTCAPFGDDDSAANFSNFATLLGDQAHMLAAPGTCLGSTFPGSTYAVFFGGTSFASPTIAGSVALCIASGPCAGKTPAQIISKFVADAAAYNTANTAYGFQGDPLRPITGKYYGYLHRAGQY